MPPPNTEHTPVRTSVRRVHKRQVNNNSAAKPGARLGGDGSNVHGGGGPENLAAQSSQSAGIKFYQSQPSWSWENKIADDYFGPAHASKEPDLSGIPSNNFRELGDAYRGRQ